MVFIAVIARASAKAFLLRLTYAPIAWVTESIPVSAVNLAGMLIVNSKSTIAAFGTSGAPAMSIFSSVSESVITVKRDTSDPVPAVVGIATWGGLFFGISFGTL